MALVTGALGSVIPKLALLLKEEYDLQKGVRKKITRLSRDLESMHAALRKVAEVPPEQLDEPVKLWARDVRELSYNVEDVVDTFLVHVDGREAPDPNIFKRAMKQIRELFSKSKARHQIGDKIKIINQQAKEVAERQASYKVDSIVSKPSPTSIVDPRLVAMYKEVTELVGIDKSSDDLISKLSLQGDDESKKNNMKMVCVVGPGGLGKTTLANVVYDRLKAAFECTAFVSVGRDPDLKKVFRDLLIKLDKEKYMDPKYSILDEGQLIDELREYLGSKRYLFIIDDIWETITGGRIKELALVKNNSESRVITTSRKLDVAEQADEVYKLRGLPYEESRKLFNTRLFGGEGKFHDKLDEASDKMLKKCDGVPLAIITMASLLVGKSREEWMEVCKSVFKNKSPQVSDTEWILSLSYYDLPAHLKTCLLYLSAYPEDYVITKDRLIWKWVAEGFVHTEEPETRLFQVGEGYFNELLNRSMIQAVELEADGIVYGCRLHDMVLDLLRLKSQEENFITISGNTIAEGASSPSSRVRRLVHQHKAGEQTHQDCTGMDLHHVRTFIAWGCDIINKDFSFQSFQLLRVLALEDSNINYGYNNIRLEHIEKLLHLRYLRLYGGMYELPEGIGALKFLQTLVLRGTKSGLPSSVALLTQLTCLRVRHLTRVPNGVMDKLTSLEELQIFLYDNAVGQLVKDLGKLRELRVLTARVTPDSMVELGESIGNLHKIRHLELLGNLSKIQWDKVVLPRPLRRLIITFMDLTAPPSCINRSGVPNITHLDLEVDEMDERALRILGGLPELRHLRLSTVTITTPPFRCISKFQIFTKFPVTSIFSYMYRAVNVGKK